MANTLNNIAVLIDADNASAKNIELILSEIDKLGTIGCKKIYGDWGSAHIKGWQEALLKYAIEPIQQFAYVKGKNATDIGMVIEAMDLLHSGHYDGFCLVSSDSDFTSLALRIRKNRLPVYGFGNNNTVDAFRQACDGFSNVQSWVEKKKKSLTSQSQVSAVPETKAIEVITPNAIAKPTKKTKPIKKINEIESKKRVKAKPVNAKPIKTKKVASAKAVNTRWTASRLTSNKKLIKLLNDAIVNHPQVGKKRWVDFSSVGSRIKNKHPSFDAKTYGYKRTSDLIKQIDCFEWKNADNQIFVRRKKA